MIGAVSICEGTLFYLSLAELTSSLPMSVLVLKVCSPLEDESSVAELDILFILTCEYFKHT